jgi:predicted ATPase/DNA-binding SARP family transcriptional activator
MLKVFLLGAPLVESHGAAVPIARRKGLALLAYLAVEGGPHRRDTLATLLWPDESQSDARSNLRRVLSELNTALGVPVFQADRETIELVKNERVWIDVAAFLPAQAAAQAHDHRGLAPCAACIGRLAAAAELYRADLLAGFSLRDSQGFDEWLVLRAEQLRGQFAQVLELLIQGYRAQGAYHEASAAARRLLALDAFDESVQRTLIELLAVAGHHSAALRQYEECARLLDQELGIAPQPETTALYQQIRAGAFRSRRSATQLEPALLAAAQRALPTPTTPFFGREQELAVVAQALADPHCRLLTILGSGGIGKTRLALHAADAYQAAGQVAFVACVALQSREDLIAAIADAAGYTFYGEDPADQQLLAHLRPRSLVLVCDNFEHLIGHAGVLSSILAAAPQIKILVTSWERLQLSEEWTLPLSGLPLPDPADFASSSAVQIFEHSARRVQPQFALAAEDVAAVARICQLVEGLPLAIELAGAWVRALSCHEIAAEIEACLGFLTSSLRDVPERHRNLRAIFDRSWQLLSEPERAVFRQLAVFRHGFCHPAAQAVAGASLPLLAAFLDKSLLRRTAAGRYESHEFIRQYTEEQLKTNQQEYAAVTARHYAYYAALLADHAGLLQRGDQPLASGVTAAEVENIRAAWAWVLEHGDLAQIAAFSEGLYQFYNTHGWYYEARDVFAQAVATLEQRPPAADPAAQATLVGRMLL